MKQPIARSSIDAGAKLTIEEGLEEISERSGLLAVDTLVFLLTFPGTAKDDDNDDDGVAVFRALAFAFSTTAWLSSRKARSTMLWNDSQ
jgi:hypothetical protein